MMVRVVKGAALPRFRFTGAAVVPNLSLLVMVWIPCLAQAYGAGHEFLERYLAGNVVFAGKPGDTLQHTCRATGEDFRFRDFIGLEAFEPHLCEVRDKSTVTTGEFRKTCEAARYFPLLQ